MSVPVHTHTHTHTHWGGVGMLLVASFERVSIANDIGCGVVVWYGRLLRYWAVKK